MLNQKIENFFWTRVSADYSRSHACKRAPDVGREAARRAHVDPFDELPL